MTYGFESAVPDFATLCPFFSPLQRPVIFQSGVQLLKLPTAMAPRVQIIPNGPKAMSADNIREGMLVDYIFQVQDKATALWERVDFIRRKTEELLSTVALFDGLKGFAHVMVNASHARSGDVTAKALKLESAATALHDKAVNTLGKDVPSYGNVESDAQLAMERAHTSVLEAIRDGRTDRSCDAKKTLKEYLDDPTIPKARKADFLRNFDLMMVSICEILTRSPGQEKVADLVKRSFDKPEESIWGQVVQAMSQVAGLSTQTAGQMGPGPDCLVISMVKCQLAYKVPKFAKAGVAVEEIKTAMAQLVVSGMRFNPEQQAAFNQLYGEAAKVQRDLLSIQKDIAARKGGVATLKQAERAKLLRRAERQKVDELRDFINREARTEAPYEGIHAGVALNGALTILSIFQVLSAWQGLAEDEGWKAGKDWADLVSGVGQAGLGALYTVNQVPLNVIKAQCWLQKLNDFLGVGKALKCVSGAIAVLGIVSGVCAIVSAAQEGNTEEIIKGAVQTASSIFLLIGALAFAPWATAIGALLMIGLAAYEIGKMIWEASRPHCENVFRKFVEPLEKAKIQGYTGVMKVLDVLKCQSEYEQLNGAIKGMSWFPLIKDDPKNKPAEEEIRKGLLTAGFSDGTINDILEPLPPPPMPAPIMYY